MENNNKKGALENTSVPLNKDAIDAARRLNKIHDSIDALYGYEIINKFERESLLKRISTW